MNRPHARSAERCALLIACSLNAHCGFDVVPLEEVSQPVVYGDDDRKEYFEIADPRGRDVLSRSTVALIPKSPSAEKTLQLTDAPTWGAVDNLCSGEPFSDQPAAAFCTGVLVDWDLLLTAGHCARAFAISDMSAVFDYYYEAPGKLAARRGDAIDVMEIVAERLDAPGVEPRLDYAWLRLARLADSTREPVPVQRHFPPMQVGDRLISVGAGGGVPIKFDAGGRVWDARNDWQDYFVADVDASRGSSGAGAFSEHYELLGVLARGGQDFWDTNEGCRVTRRVTNEPPMEQFTYAYRALADLCALRPDASSLCRNECDAPCRALPRPIAATISGCSQSGLAVATTSPLAGSLAMTFAAVLGWLRSIRRRASRRGSALRAMPSASSTYLRHV